MRFTTSELFAHFDRIADAPDAIPRLRRFILDLAVRGKLVEQDPNDVSASELLKQIQMEKNRLAHEDKIRKQPSRPLVEMDELPYEIPTKWQWTRLGEIGFTQTGTTPSKNNKTHFGDYVPFIKPGDLYLNNVDYANEGLSETGLKESGRLAPAGSLLMVCIGTIGKCQLIDRECSFNQQINSLTPYGRLCSQYVLSVWRSEYFQKSAWAASARTTIAILNKGKWERLLLPLPPLAEQHRIVAKVDELMALCDRLEAAQAERERRRDRLAAASLHRLNNGVDASDFREHARFHLDHLVRFTTRPDQISALRQTILNLAVRGKLVPQDPNDEPAPQFNIIENFDQQDRLTLELPIGWSWAKVEDVADARLGKMLDKAKNSGRAYRYLRNTNVHWFDVRLDELKEIRIEDSEFDKYLLSDGDVLICEGGHGIGRTAVWRANESDIVFQKALHRVRPSGVLNSDFFAYCMFVYFHANVLQTYFTGVGIPHFTGKALSALVFPLPPLAEQHRIVAKVEELMTLCDQLEAQLTNTQTESRRLLEAVLHEALTPAA